MIEPYLDQSLTGKESGQHQRRLTLTVTSHHVSALVDQQASNLFNGLVELSLLLFVLFTLFIVHRVPVAVSPIV